MKATAAPCRNWVAFALLLLVLALTAVSCKRDPADESAASTAEIRGEPIQSPAPPAAAVASPAAPTPASTPDTTPPVAAIPAPTSPPTSEPVAQQQPPAPAPAAGAGTVLVDAAAPSGNTGIPGSSSTGNSATPSAATSAADSAQHQVVGFDRLSAFVYEVPDDPADTNATTVAKLAGQIPAPVKALDKRLIALKGFMLPLKVEGGLVTELLVMRDQSMCCFGTVPKINEWVSVKMTAKGVKPIMDQPVTLFGRLHVGEIRENGYLVGIYQMDGERMAGPLDN